MKITILQGAFLPIPPKLGGAVEKLWFALGKDFAKQGHEVIQISRSFSNMVQEEWIEGVLHKRIVGYSTPRSGLYLKWLDLLYTLKAKKIIPPNTDIIVTNTFWAPILLPKNLKERCMIDVGRMPKGQMKLYTACSRLRANSSVVSKAIKQEILSRYQKKVITIPNPLPFKDIQNTDLKEKKKVILYVGRIHQEKGLEILLNAFKGSATDWKLKIVGPCEFEAGGGGKTYLNLLTKLTLGYDVTFTGPVFNTDELQGYYREASIFVYPSVAERGETFGLAPLEAMAWGCVPIVSDLACFRDFIKNEQNGLVFDHKSKHVITLLTDVIVRLEKDHALRIRLAQEALNVKHTHSSICISSLFLKEFVQMMNEINDTHQVIA